MDEFEAFGAAEEGDAFAEAGTSDPFAAAGGMQMASQEADYSAPRALKHDDYTPEELEMIEKVSQQEQERKKALYEKMQAEE